MVFVGIAALAAVAAGFADQAGQGDAYYAVTGHAFAVGEQQVYLIQRTSALTLRYRDARGDLKSQTDRENISTSLAWTVEGIGADGGPILAVASASAGAKPALAPGPRASPVLNPRGIGSASGVLSELAPVSFLLSSFPSDVPEVGTSWTSSGVLSFRYGTLMLSMKNTAVQPTGEDSSLVQVASSGATDLQGTATLAGVGATTLQGNGGATGFSYIEPKDRMLLGMTLSAFSRGKAKYKDQTGTYDLDIRLAVKLQRYVPGLPALAIAPNFLTASAYIGDTAAPETFLYSTAAPALVASPAATDTEFIPPATSAVTPYPSALPAESFPPVPIPLSSNQPIASPPPPPIPSPSPTRYY
jgi:hypothetical protein